MSASITLASPRSKKVSAVRRATCANAASVESSSWACMVARDGGGGVAQAVPSTRGGLAGKGPRQPPLTRGVLSFADGLAAAPPAVDIAWRVSRA